MLRLETIPPETLVLLKRVQSLPALKDTRLVGGAALALHFGHRTSIDLDLFGEWTPEVPLEISLAECGKVEKGGGDGKTFQFFSVNGVKIDCVASRSTTITYNFSRTPTIFSNYTYRGLRYLPLEENTFLISASIDSAEPIE